MNWNSHEPTLMEVAPTAICEMTYHDEDHKVIHSTKTGIFVMEMWRKGDRWRIVRPHNTGTRRADTENFVLGILLKFKNHRITFDDAVQQLTDRIHTTDHA